MLNGDFGTHQTALLQAVLEVPTGPVVELGCGHFSTPLLHLLCRQRDLYTLESDVTWLRQFEHLARSRHQFWARPEGDWELAWTQLFNQLPDELAVVFLDHAPSEARVWALESLRPRTAVFVLHDTEPEAQRVYGFEPYLSTFAYRRDYQRLVPHTTVVSDLVDVRKWESL